MDQSLNPRSCDLLVTQADSLFSSPYVLLCKGEMTEEMVTVTNESLSRTKHLVFTMSSVPHTDPMQDALPLSPGYRQGH